MSPRKKGSKGGGSRQTSESKDDATPSSSSGTLLEKTTGLAIQEADRLPSHLKAKKLAPGTMGRKVKIVTNAFGVSVKESVAFKYAVISMGSRRVGGAPAPPPSASGGSQEGDNKGNSFRDIVGKKVRSLIFEAARKTVPQLKGSRVVYDKMNSFYSIAKPLPTPEGEIVFQCSLEEEAVKEYRITYKQAMDSNNNEQRRVDLMDASDSEAVTVKQLCLNFQLEQQPNVIVRGSSQFKAEKGFPLGRNQELLTGMHSSVRQGITQEGVPFNMIVSDVAAGIYNKGGKMTDILTRILNVRDVRQIRGLTDQQRRIMLDEIKGLKVQFLTADSNRKSFLRRLRIDDLTTTDVTRTFFDYEGRKTSVFDYFKNHRNPKVTLQLPNLPCIGTQRQDRTFSYTPMEICTLIAGQHYEKTLPLEIASVVTGKTALDPQVRFNQIIGEVDKNIARGSNSIMDLNVTAAPIITDGRIMDHPRVQFKDTRGEQVVDTTRTNWDNPCDFGKGFIQLNQPAALKVWRIVEFVENPAQHKGDVHPQVAQFAKELVTKGKELGMDIAPPFHFISIYLNPQTRFRDLKGGLSHFQTSMVGECAKKYPGGKGNSLIMVILPRKDPVYRDIKGVCNELGLTSQVVALPNLTKRGKVPNTFAPLRTMVDNLLKKMNAKLGGVNATLHESSLKAFPPNSMVCGLDVYHPGPGSGPSASIAGILASYTHDFTKYFSCAISQPQEAGTFKRKEEVEKGLDAVMERFFLRYKDRNGKFPSFILFYRDGVSDGQLERVIHKEAKQIFDAMRKLNFTAKLALITVQKRHPIRLFSFTKDAKGNFVVSNPLPGTVVDKDIVNPEWTEFYTNSHHALKGTAKPAQYKLIVNQIDGMNMDRLQQMSYYLCYVFQRCYKPISCPTPARYAHLVAEKAAELLESAIRNNDMRGRSIDEVIQTHPHFSDKLIFQ